MDNKRRDFLKVAGISTLAGLGGTAVIDRLVNASNIAHASVAAGTDAGHAEAAGGHGAQPAASGIRYGMVVDVRKFREDASLGEKVVAACHSVHNVPEFPDKKDEIKWIWMTHFENAFPESPNLYRDEANAGYELPIGIEIFRGRYLKSFATPAPLKPGKVERYTWKLPDVDHVFLPGHRLMVQVQSTLFPLYDRNPQTYVDNIMYAKREDYRSATQSVWFGGDQASAILLPVVR